MLSHGSAQGLEKGWTGAGLGLPEDRWEELRGVEEGRGERCLGKTLGYHSDTRSKHRLL